jgi:hypothetical protein
LLYHYDGVESHHCLLGYVFHSPITFQEMPMTFNLSSTHLKHTLWQIAHLARGT